MAPHCTTVFLWFYMEVHGGFLLTDSIWIHMKTITACSITCHVTKVLLPYRTSSRECGVSQSPYGSSYMWGCTGSRHMVLLYGRALIHLHVTFGFHVWKSAAENSKGWAWPENTLFYLMLLFREYILEHWSLLIKAIGLVHVRFNCELLLRVAHVWYKNILHVFMCRKGWLI